MDPRNAKIVFISSTCYDLVDLRPELRYFLEQNGFRVSVSDDPDSAFYVEPLDNSIDSCLNNVEAADAVVCILDRRYGGVLKDGAYKDLSATHAEIRHARSLVPQKPVFFFIREAAFQEYQHIRRNPAAFNPAWVEPDKSDNRKRWADFVAEVSKYPKHENWSNWCDTFKTSVDLKGMVLKRLSDQFPDYRASVALRPDRLVRLYFVDNGILQKDAYRSQLVGGFRNLGVGPALKIRHGWRRQNGQEEEVGFVGGLPELDYLTHSGESAPCYDVELGVTVLFCEYSNVHNDHYRIEVPIKWGGGRPEFERKDQFFIGYRDGSKLKWVQVD